jgi:dUTP pyrophosphatase
MYRHYVREVHNIGSPYTRRPGIDAGYDLLALEDTWIWPFQTKLVKTNHRIEVREGEMGIVVGRSGRNLKGWLTHIGIIDTGYTGNLGCIITNLRPYPRKIRKGERIAQIVFTPVNNALHLMETSHAALDCMAVGDRGNKGYGSSGE